MKKILSTLVLSLVATVMLLAQAPQTFSYQTVVRDNNWQVIQNQSIGIQVDIVEDIASGSIVYSEEHTATTNDIGLINLAVGGGTVAQGLFSNIDWGNHSYFMKISVDVSGGSNYVAMGTTQLRSVPYALFAETSNNAGPQGIQGVAGNDGVDGVDGIDGTNGLDGIDGVDGLAGAQGIQGLQGDTGVAGVQGSIGLTGAQGIQGLQGDTGIAGTNGVNGIDGTNGVDGADGTNGVDGLNGTNGAVGATGPQGLQGLAGNDGADGTNGIDGNDGVDGANGTNGVDGAVGATGLQGIAGNDGADGTNGVDGLNGTNGVNGAVGATGAQGIQGVAGNSSGPTFIAPILITNTLCGSGISLNDSIHINVDSILGQNVSSIIIHSEFTGPPPIQNSSYYVNLEVGSWNGIFLTPVFSLSSQANWMGYYIHYSDVSNQVIIPNNNSGQITLVIDGGASNCNTINGDIKIVGYY